MSEPEAGDRRPGSGPGSRQVACTLLAAFGAGFLVVYVCAGPSHDRMLPWIVGRGLGIAAYLALAALVLTGTWFSHPWRLRWPLLHPAVLLRSHAVLAAGTLVLVAGHVVALVADRYAGVGLTGAVVPGASGYRPAAVALGVVALYLGLAAGGAAALAGRILVGRRWLGLHRLAAATFALTWFHGVLSGSDTPALRLVYAGTGLVVLAAAVTRFVASPPAVRLPADGGGRGPSPASSGSRS
ncbi:MAG: hypothetical protein ACYCU7_12215 [Acidimicrobiales bacterium]